MNNQQNKPQQPNQQRERSNPNERKDRESNLGSDNERNERTNRV